jgi:hypothetical protein
MMLEVNAEEEKYLLELLETTHKEMLHEINHTDTHDYRDMLKNKLTVIDGLMAKLKSSSQQK